MFTIVERILYLFPGSVDSCFFLFYSQNSLIFIFFRASVGWSILLRAMRLVPGSVNECVQMLNNGSMVALSPGGLREGCILIFVVICISISDYCNI